MGYNSREIASIRQLCFDILLELEQHGGEHATALIRRCVGFAFLQLSACLPLHNKTPSQRTSLGMCAWALPAAVPSGWVWQRQCTAVSLKLLPSSQLHLPFLTGPRTLLACTHACTATGTAGGWTRL